MSINSWNAELTANGVLTANASASGAESVVLNNGQLLIGSTGDAPEAATLTVGSGFMSPLPGAGSLELQPNNWRLLSTLSASSSATLDLVDLPVGPSLGQFNRLFIQWYSRRPSVVGSNLLLRTSNNNGSSFADSGYLAGLNYWSYNSATTTNINSTTANIVSGPTSGGSGTLTASGYCFLGLVGNGVLFGSGTSMWMQTNTNPQFGLFFVRPTSTGTNAFRFLFSDGNITSGLVSIYGLQTVLP